MDTHILDILLFLFYAVAIIALGLAIGNALHVVRRAPRTSSRGRPGRRR
jgi:hypothetical protein